ncbi:hypothetical protein BKA69DRAFT_107690 [Paraphysoderma sedebokerense]|nr:hypothetical protein BKA69DRAFT_107690 [Paraphysoderma sedebokerense]
MHGRLGSHPLTSRTTANHISYNHCDKDGNRSMTKPRIEFIPFCYNCCRRNLSELDFWKGSQRLGTCGKCRKTGPYEGVIFSSPKSFKKALHEAIVRTVKTKREEYAELATCRDDSDDGENSMGEVLTTVPFEFVALIEKESLAGDNDDSIFREIQECVEKADGYHYRNQSKKRQKNGVKKYLYCTQRKELDRYKPRKPDPKRICLSVSRYDCKGFVDVFIPANTAIPYIGLKYYRECFHPHQAKFTVPANLRNISNPTSIDSKSLKMSTIDFEVTVTRAD